jgi:hypothetical protein
MEYLRHLPLSPAEGAKLSELGAPTPAALLAMVKASPEAFAGWFGSARTASLARALEALIGEEDRRVIESTPSVSEYTIGGAIIGGTAPDISQPGYDLNERDRLFEQLRQLRAVENPSALVKERASELEEELNALMRGA